MLYLYSLFVWLYFSKIKIYLYHFFLFCISINNLIDEIVGLINNFIEKPLYDPTRLNWNELMFAILIPIIYKIRKKNKK